MMISPLSGSFFPSFVPFFRPFLVGWLVGWLVGRLDGWTVGRLVGWLVLYLRPSLFISANGKGRSSWVVWAWIENRLEMKIREMNEKKFWRRWIF